MKRTPPVTTSTVNRYSQQRTVTVNPTHGAPQGQIDVHQQIRFERVWGQRQVVSYVPTSTFKPTPPNRTPAATPSPVAASSNAYYDAPAGLPYPYHDLTVGQAFGSGPGPLTLNVCGIPVDYYPPDRPLLSKL